MQGSSSSSSAAYQHSSSSMTRKRRGGESSSSCSVIATPFRFLLVLLFCMTLDRILLQRQLFAQYTASSVSTTITENATASSKKEEESLILDDSKDKNNLMRQVAPAYFPVDPQTGQIPLEAEVTSVVIDVGARESDYLRVLEQDKSHKNGTALFLVDPLPASVVPLLHRVAQYATQTRRWNQAFVMRAAMGEVSDVVHFNVALGPACGSILETSANNKFWCAETKERIETLVLRLQDFLALLPDVVGTNSSDAAGAAASPSPRMLQSIHLKVDAEGADLAVLKGAGWRLQTLDTIIIECNAPNLTKSFRDGECTFDDAKTYMEGQGFDMTYEGQGDLVNMYFVNRARKEAGLVHDNFPPYLRAPQLTFRNFYTNVAATGVGIVKN